MNSCRELQDHTIMSAKIAVHFGIVSTVLFFFSGLAILGEEIFEKA